MPHRRHRVRVHVHNRYVRTQPAQQTGCCKKRCKKGSRCRRGGDALYQPEGNPCDRPVGAGVTRNGQQQRRGCQRFHSAEEVCRRGCGRRGGPRADTAAAEDGRYAGYESDGGGRPCSRSGPARTLAGGCDKRATGSRPGTPCERFKSAEETCRSCPKRGGDRQRYGDPGGRNYTVYTAQVQQPEFAGKQLSVQASPDGPTANQPVTVPCGQDTKLPHCPDPNEITEEIIHTREHRWHIPSAAPAVSDPCASPPGPGRRGGPGSSDGSLGTAPRSRRAPVPLGESDSDRGRRAPPSEPGVRRTRSELLAGRQLVARIARQVELDDGTAAEHQLVYRLSAQYSRQFADYDSGSESDSESERRPPASEPGTERTGRSSRTADTVLRIERLRLEEVSGTPSSSDTGGAPAGSGSPRPAPRSARLAEPPSPLPRRQVTSEPTLPAPAVRAPAPATRATRSLDCQPVPLDGREGRTKRLRTRGALTRLRQASVTRLNEERQRQLLNERTIIQNEVQLAGKPSPDQPAGKPSPDQPSDGADDGGRRDITVLHAQNLLPADYQGPGSRGDAASAAAEPIYQNVDALYDGGAGKPADSPGGFSPVQPEAASPYLTRADDLYQPDQARYSENGNYGEYGAARSPYLDTSPAGRSGRARFDDDDHLGAALYEQRYQPRWDNSPYLSRPTGGPAPAAAPGTDIRAGAAPTGARLQRQGGQQKLGVGRRGVGLGQRLTSGFSSLRQRGAALYRRLSGGRGQAGRGRGRGRAAPARLAARGAGRAGGRRPGGKADSCSCSDSDSSCGAVNCSFLFYFNGDGGPSPFMCNIPAAITGSGAGGAGSMPKKYCGMCD
ncbi:uncharacterized protein LOC122367865 [Amphibalanus amphitrite]|uniref:uncharacterized protein LOC122367865 n=1 Tax=Amphibalanus amphitrite TaxID=1232801 RepID=UPI001C91A4D4|nr:uncharacterized protein LOC122367865 [Amphibalanus amphitrite]